MENKNIKKMAKMLQSGATMLDKYCPQCENILFRLKNDTIFCPVCEKQIIIMKGNQKYQEKIVEPVKIEENSISFFELNNFFSKKLSELTTRLDESNDLFSMEKILEIIEKILIILKHLRELQR